MSPPLPEYGQRPIPGLSPDGRPYAEWVWRVLAFLIDFVPVAILLAISSACLSIFYTDVEVTRNAMLYGQPESFVVIEQRPSVLGWILCIIFWLAGTAFWYWNKGLREGKTGMSIGKQATGYITVGDQTNEPIGVGKGVLRAFLLSVEIVLIFPCLIGLICLAWPLWDRKRQTLLSDKATRAVVFKST